MKHSEIKLRKAKPYQEMQEASDNNVDIKLLDVRKDAVGTDNTFHHKILWENVAGYAIFHIFALWGIFLLFMGNVRFITAIWVALLAVASEQGVTMGAHRLYSHKSFKATPLLRAILIIFQTMAGQWSIYTWARDHRLHHRYSDTDADPHNSERGFFFSHMGWLMCKKHPSIVERGKDNDVSDLKADWMVMIQKKYFLIIYVFVAILFPIWIPVHLFGESWRNSLLVCYFARYAYNLHATFLINSAAHRYGTRPYDKNLVPVESWIVSLVSGGEGWHNYHHAFPWDYRAAELWYHINLTAVLIRLCAKLGLAYDLKTASKDIVEKRILRTGDGTHTRLGNSAVIKTLAVVS